MTSSPHNGHVLELFAGSCQVSRVFAKHGYSVDPWENEPRVLTRAQVRDVPSHNVYLFPLEDYRPCDVKVVWASPPATLTHYS